MPKTHKVNKLGLTIAMAFGSTGLWAGTFNDPNAVITENGLGSRDAITTGTGSITNSGTTVTVTSSDADAKLNIQGTLSAANTGNGQGIYVGGNQSASLNVTGELTVNMGTHTDTAILMSSNGNATATITGVLNITNNADDSDAERDGLEVNATGAVPSNSTITHSGRGTINVQSGNALFARSTNGNTSVVVDGTSVSLITGGTSSTVANNGISATASDGSTTVASNAAITTNTGASNGIYAASATGTSVTNSGNLTVNNGANNSSAIKAHTTGAGNATVGNTGLITINGSNSFGINASSNGTTQVTQRADKALTGLGNNLTAIYAGGALAEIMAKDALNNTGKFDITLNGINTIGLHANGTTSANIENVAGNITVGGAVGSFGATGSAGIKAETQGVGKISYNDSTGAIKVTSGSTGSGAYMSAGISGVLNAGATAGDMTITVDDIQKIEVDVGQNATGILAFGEAGATGNLTVNFNKGEIDSKGANADGINAYHAGIGDVGVNSYGMIAATAKTGSFATVEGVYAYAAAGSTTINAAGNIAVHGEDNGAGVLRANSATGSASITYDDAAGKLIATSNQNALAYGVSASAGATGTTNVWIKNVDEISTTASNNRSSAILGTSIDGNSLVQIDQANKISNIGGGIAVQAETSGAGNANIYISSNVDYIFSDGQSSGGINEGVYAAARGTGNASIESHAKEIYVKGQNNDGVYANAANGDATVIASGIVRTERVNAADGALYGLVAQTNAANKTATVHYFGDVNTFIDTKGINSSAVLLRAGNGGNAVANIYDATLTTSGNNSDGITLEVLGAASVGTATSQIINTRIATDGINSSGIRMQTVDGEGNVDLNHVLIQANQAGSSGLFSKTNNGNSTFTLDKTSAIQGGLGAGAGVDMNSTGTALLTLDNAGSITSLNDQAINSSNVAGASVFNNTSTGVLKGFFTITGNDVTLNNHKGGLIDLQDFSSGAKGAVNSSLGGVAVFNHNGLLKFSDNNLDGTVSTARFDGVSAFNHYGDGVIDTASKNPNIGNNGLTGNNIAGDSITIGNGGTGTYVSGGVWNMNVLLDDARSNGGLGISDTLNLDNVVTGTGATAPASLFRSARPGSVGDGKGPLGATVVYVNPTANSFGDLTHDEGIRVVGAISSSDDAFKLGNYVTRGAYQYVLNKGLGDNNWYLSSREANDSRKPIYNPSTGAYLANQTAAANMFMHTLFDRQGNSNNIAGDSDEPRSVWMRVKYHSSEGQTANKSMDTETDTTIIHLGADLAKWNMQDGNFHLGLMAGYGESKTDIDPHYTATKAKGKVEGYNVGVYGTWFADEASGKGLYLDGWAQYGWFDNKVSGPSQVNAEEKYDSSAITASIEAGYSIALGRSSSTEWMLVPQAQLAYTDLSTDDYLDGNNLRIHGSKASGVFARLGTRLHAQAVEKTNSIQPFAEVNWLYGSAKNQMQFNQVTLEDSSQPDNRLEMKLGLQGTITKNLKVWGQAEGQWGKDSFSRYGGQVGVNYQW